MRTSRRTIATLHVGFEHDVISARQRARQVAAALGFDVSDQARIAVAVAEVAGNAFTYAGHADVTYLLENATQPQMLLVQVTDRGPGIDDLEAALNSAGGPNDRGLGLAAARRLMDVFEVESSPGDGTTVLLGKRLPATAPALTATDVDRISKSLQRDAPRDPFDEMREQDRELLRILDELRHRESELDRLNRELDDTNRGVVALYAELDERAQALQNAVQLRDRFLRNMSHELRTPLSSILSLSRLLLDRADGPLTAEQEKQARYILQAAEDLSTFVNDLLDLATVEAGRLPVRPSEFRVADLFAALRGLFRPLLTNPFVRLTFQDPNGIPPLVTDETKVSQILRNFISNALKFTDKGEVMVSAELEPQGDRVVFMVADTGIGIAPEQQAVIFEEFTRVETPAQRRTKGTGLGLPLARRLAELLGGNVRVESTPEVGSRFYAAIPLAYREP